MSAAKAPELVKIRTTHADFTHKGKDYKAGEEYEVPAKVGATLVNAALAEPVRKVDAAAVEAAAPAPSTDAASITSDSIKPKAKR